MKENVLKQLMQDHKISQSTLARKTGVPQPTIHRFLVGKTLFPSFQVMKKLASHFDVSVDDLYASNEE